MFGWLWKICSCCRSKTASDEVPISSFPYLGDNVDVGIGSFSSTYASKFVGDS